MMGTSMDRPRTKAQATTCKPVVKIPGGKRRLLPDILKFVPEHVSTYAEPFVGGGALFFALAAEKKRRFDRALLGDTNKDLVDFYRVLRDAPEALIDALRKYKYDRAMFDRVRSKWNMPGIARDPIERAAAFLYLNRTCYNGLMRVNSKGEFNAPFGKHKNPTICDTPSLIAASIALKDVEIVCADFASITRQLMPGDFVYLDPPYAPSTNTADFDKYTAAGFTNDDQIRLSREFLYLKREGIATLMSNSDVPLTRTLYKGQKIVRVTAARAINRDPTKRGGVTELLISAAIPRAKTRGKKRAA